MADENLNTLHTLLLPAASPEALDRALSVLASGGLVAFPTDTLYAVGALVSNPSGLARLEQAGVHAPGQSVPILAGDPDQLETLTPGLPPFAQLLAAHFWPGALTLVVPRSPALPSGLSPLPSVGVRMPNHPFALQLLRRSGPLASAAARLPGQQGALTARHVMEQLEGRVELVIDGGPLHGGLPSTVVDCTQDSLRILRPGAVPEDVIRRFLDRQR